VRLKRENDRYSPGALNSKKGGFFMPKFETLILTKENILYKKSSTISHYCDVVTTLFLKGGR
jgi:hypothetical protein